MTTERQAELIAKHGAFYLALYKGEHSPRSPAQQHFVKNVRSGQSTNEHELTFLMWLAHNPKFKNKKAVDDRPTSDSNSLNCQGTNTQLSEADLLFCKELYDGFRMPETEEQDSFARNVQNGVATNDHERAFLKWLNPAQTPKTTPTSKPKPAPKPKLTPKPTPKPRPTQLANQNRSKRAQKTFSLSRRSRPAYRNTTKKEWKQSFQTPDDMKGDWEPSKLSKMKSSAPQDDGPRGVRAHGDPARNRANRRKDRYGRPTDQ